MRRFEIAGSDGRVTVEIEDNTITATFHGWERNQTQAITPDLPDRMQQAVHTLETFSERPGFRIEEGELAYLDDDGEAYDDEPTLKLYDDALRVGMGVVWCLISEDVLWGTARGNHAQLPDGTILRDGTVNPEAHREARSRSRS